MKVRDSMTSPVFTISAEQQLIAASEIMSWRHVRHVPVVDHAERLVGLISHRDVLRASMADVGSTGEADQSRHLEAVRISDIMRRNVQTIGPDVAVREAARTMRSERIGCLPVIDEGVLIGILTEHDLLHYIEQIEDVDDDHVVVPRLPDVLDPDVD
jgi:CBS domain-containing protein